MAANPMKKSERKAFRTIVLKGVLTATGLEVCTPESLSGRFANRERQLPSGLPSSLRCGKVAKPSLRCGRFDFRRGDRPLTSKPFQTMAQAIMDPEEVRRFAKELKRFNEDVQVRAASLQARFTALGSTWQDQEAEKFADEFLSTMKVLRKFMEVSEKHTPYLLRKAQRIEEYLAQQ